MLSVQILLHPVLGHINTVLTIVVFIRLKLNHGPLIDISFGDKNSGVIVTLSNSMVLQHSLTVSCVLEQSKENFI